MKKIFLSLSMILFFHAGTGFGDDSQSVPNVMSFLDSAETMSNEEFERNFHLVYMHKREIEEKMIQLLKDENLDSKKKAALCYLLGEYHDRVVIPILIDNITLKSNFDPIKSLRRMPLWYEYPAQEALIKIGKDSVSDVITALKTEKDENVIKLLSGVIKGVEGKKIGQIVLQDAVDAEKDPDKKKRLENALAYFDDQTKPANQPSTSSNASSRTPNVSATPTSKTASEQFGATTIILVVVAFLLLVDIMVRLRKKQKTL